MKTEKTKIMFRIFSLALLFIMGLRGGGDLSAQTLKEETKARGIAKRMIDRDDGWSEYSNILLLSCYYKETGEGKRCSSSPRKKIFETIRKDTGIKRKDTIGLSVINRPPSEKNVAFLQRDYDREGKDSDQWIYLPALKKLKRIVSESSGSPKTGSFFGSELSYEDLEKVRLSDYRYSYEGASQIDGKDAHIITSYPSPRRAPGTSYGKVTTWVDTATYLPLRSDLYNRQDKLVKTIYMKNIVQSRGVWIAKQTIVVNYGSRRMSMMKINKFAVNIRIPEELFGSRALKDVSFREKKMNEVRSSAGEKH